MADKPEEKPERIGPDTLRPPTGDEASDLYSSATVVRAAPTDLVEYSRSKPTGVTPARPNAPADVAPSSKKMDDLWEQLRHAGAGDDEDDDEDEGRASGHAAQDVTKMLVMPEGLLPEELKQQLSPQQQDRLREAEPSIMVSDGVEAHPLSSRRPSTPPPRSAPPPPGSQPDSDPDTSPGRAAPRGQVSRSQWVLLAVTLVAVVFIIYMLAAK